MPSKANKTSGSRETARGSRDLSPSRSLPSSALPSASLNESKAHQPAESPIYDVAVVGAGLSGLQCAAALVGKHGLDRSSVIVLEASEKIGGRVEQIDTFIPGLKIDIGAETLHSSNSFLPDIVTHGRNESVYPVFCHAQGNGGPSGKPIDGGYALYYIAGSKKLLRFDDNDPDFVRINQLLWDLATLNTSEVAASVPLRQHLEKLGASPDMLDIAAAGFANRLCANLDSLPLRKIADATRMIQGSGSGLDCRFANSLAGLVSDLAEGLDVRLNCAVTRVCFGGRLATDYGAVKPTSSDYDNAIVTVDLSDGRTIRAKKVVVSTPISVLKRGLIAFEPGLPQCKLAALRGMDQLPALKILLKFKQCPWPRKLQALVMAGCVVPEVLLYEVPPLVVAENAKADPDNAAVCYCSGFCTADFARRAAAMSEQELVQAFLQQLDDAFSSMKARHVVASVEAAAKLTEIPTLPKPSSVCVGSKIFKWDESNPFVGGGFSSYVVEAPGSDKEHSEGHLRAPVADKLFFAGEATTKGKGGCIKGALVSGVIAADKVHDSLAKPRLTDAIDRYFRFSEEATVVGFGSLLSEPSARNTFPNLRDFRVVRVRGYRRVFAHTPSVFVERGLVNPGSLFQSSLSAEPVYVRGEDGSLQQDLSVGFLAVCFSVPLNDVTHSLGFQGMGGRQWCGEALLKREEEFNFDIVPCHKITKKTVETAAGGKSTCGYILDPDAHSVPGLMCVAATDEDYIERWGEEYFRSKLEKTGHRTIWGWSRDSSLKPCSAYFTHCYLAAQSLGTHVFDSFLDETYLVDRKTTVRTYISRHPDVLFNQPPPIHESRYMSPPSTPRRRNGGEANNSSSSTSAGAPAVAGSPASSGQATGPGKASGAGESVWQRNQSALVLGGFALAAIVASAFVLSRKK